MVNVSVLNPTNLSAVKRAIGGRFTGKNATCLQEVSEPTQLYVTIQMFLKTGTVIKNVRFGLDVVES